jgi:hypothetical protein
MKRTMLGVFALALLVGSLPVAASAATRDGSTLLVVPARYSVMQVAFDLANKHSIVLVSYQGDATTSEPLLFAWNGNEWVKITLQEYADASFVQTAPSRVILVGDEQLLPPALADSAARWCLNVVNIPTIDTATLVNSFASIYSFKKAEWQWFSKRYNLELTDVNEPRRKESWYDRKAYQDEYNQKWGWLNRKTEMQPAAEPAAEQAPPVEQSTPVESAPAVIGTDESSVVMEPQPVPATTELPAESLAAPVEAPSELDLPPAEVIEEPAPEMTPAEAEQLNLK